MCRTIGSSEVLFFGDKAVTAFCWTILAISGSTSSEVWALDRSGVLGVVLSVPRAAATSADGDVFAPFVFIPLPRGERCCKLIFKLHQATHLILVFLMVSLMKLKVDMRQTDGKKCFPIDSRHYRIISQAVNPICPDKEIAIRTCHVRTPLIKCYLETEFWVCKRKL